jgi:hypothetical protein
VPAVEPAEAGRTTITGFAQCEHRNLLNAVCADGLTDVGTKRSGYNAAIGCAPRPVFAPYRYRPDD